MFVKILHKRYPGKSRRSQNLLFNLSRGKAFSPLKLTSFFARVQLWGSLILFLNVDIFTSKHMAFPSKRLPSPKLDFSGYNLRESNKSFQSKIDKKTPWLSLVSWHVVTLFPHSFPTKQPQISFLCRIMSKEATQSSTLSAIKHDPERLKRLNLVVHWCTWFVVNARALDLINVPKALFSKASENHWPLKPPWLAKTLPSSTQGVVPFSPGNCCVVDCGTKKTLELKPRGSPFGRERPTCLKQGCTEKEIPKSSCLPLICLL